MIPVADPFMQGIRPSGLQRGRGGFLRSADDAPWVSDPSGEVCKGGDRKGEPKRTKYGSPSGVGRLIENDVGLTKYRQRLTLLGIGMEQSLATACSHLADLPIGSPEFNTAADTIVVCADRITRSSLAADRGTHGHLLTELFDREEELTDGIVAAGALVGLDRNAQRATIGAWRDMLATNGLEILAIEASCVDDTWRLAGTLDRIVRTTKPLTFVKPGGELVTIPANTVLILDIKFGKCRKAHPIQIASYAQSVPYDTDTEERGEWPYQIDQTHALIAHGDFGDEFRPVSIELVWVDLVAGREHGGQCVVDAKSWAARDDVFSVAQIVEGVAEDSLVRLSVLAATTPSTLSPDTQIVEGVAGPRPLAAVVPVLDEHHTPSTPSSAGMPDPSAPLTVGEEAGAAAGHSPAIFEDVYEVGDATLDINNPTLHGCDPPCQHDIIAKAMNTGGYLSPSQSRVYGDDVPPSVWPLADPDRLALVDARGQLCATPDEGADLSDGFDELWNRLRKEFDQLPPVAKTWRSQLAIKAKQRGVSFMAQEGKTERRYHINRGLIALAIVDADDEILRAILALVLGDIAWFVGIEPGHLVGSLNHVEAAKFADLCDTYISPPPAGDAA